MHLVQLIDSQQVLFKEGVERLPIRRSDEPGQSDEREFNRPPTQENSHVQDPFSRSRADRLQCRSRARNGFREPLRDQFRREEPLGPSP